MQRLLRFYGTSIGKKVVMAVTGLMLFGFVAGHLAGNLKVFTGAVKFNAYAEFLREVGAPLFSHGELLWVARFGLLAALGLHVVAALQLVLQARRARPEAYRRMAHLEDTFASRTMRSGGILIFAFVVYHLMHLTWGNAHPAFVTGDPYANLVRGFQSVGVSLGYIVAVSVVGLHVYHGIWSSLQTLGLNQEGHTRWRKASAAVATLVVLGNISIPLAVLAGVVR